MQITEVLTGADGHVTCVRVTDEDNEWSFALVNGRVHTTECPSRGGERLLVPRHVFLQVRAILHRPPTKRTMEQARPAPQPASNTDVVEQAELF